MPGKKTIKKSGEPKKAKPTKAGYRVRLGVLTILDFIIQADSMSEAKSKFEEWRKRFDTLEPALQAYVPGMEFNEGSEEITSVRVIDPRSREYLFDYDWKPRFQDIDEREGEEAVEARPLYLCRWPNGDFSLVSSHGREAAIEALDEVANAEGCPILDANDSEFMAHFALTDDGRFELEGFGEDFRSFLDKVYPALAEADFTNPEELVQAVKIERERVKPDLSEVPAPETEIGREIKQELDMPTSLIDRQIKRGATERLKKFKPKGKPH